MQETERLPCSKNERFPGPIPRVPSLSRSQNISSFRKQGHCIFIPILFPLNGSRKLSGSCSSSSAPGFVCYPDPDLMFSLTVTSSAPQCVTDAEDTQLATGQGGGGGGVDMKQTCSVRLPLCISPVLLYTLLRLWAFSLTRILPRWSVVKAGDVRTDRQRRVF